MSKYLNSKKIDFDYTNKKISDIDTVNKFLKEYNKIGGMFCVYYPLVSDRDLVDKIWQEYRDKKFLPEFKAKLVFKYLEQTLEMERYGVEMTDTIEFNIEKHLFIEYSKGIVKYPIVGDLVYIPYVNLLFEITNVIDAKAVFFGNPMVWNLSATIANLSHEDLSIENKHFKQNEPLEINKQIDKESEENFTYTEDNNPFNY